MHSVRINANRSGRDIVAGWQKLLQELDVASVLSDGCNESTAKACPLLLSSYKACLITQATVALASHTNASISTCCIRFPTE